MTNSEYIGKSLSKFEVSSDDVELILVENGLTGERMLDLKAAKSAICKSLGVWLPIFSSVSEGGVSKSWNFDALKLYYSSLCNELGVANTTSPSVRDRSYLW
ncbi:MAG: DUF6706 family protein [Paludibacter sp.]